MPGLYRKKCKACQHDNHFNSKKCGGALDIESPGRPRGTSISNLLEDQGELLPVRAICYRVSVVHVTCSYGYE